jgi:hypothetical protein
MADYCKVFGRIWNDPDFIALDSDPQRVYLMLLSYPTRDNAGVIPLTLRRWVNATADMTVERFTAALRALTAARFIVIDWNTEEVLIRTLAKNDETFHQTNIWINALKSARKIQSALLRWTLANELEKLPSHKAEEKTAEAINALVATIPEGFHKAIAEGFPEDPGVGALRSNRMHQAPTPTPTPPPAPPPNAIDPEPHDPPAGGRSATPGAKLVGRIIPPDYPNAIRTELRLQANALLKEGQPPNAIEAALELWLTKPGIGPRLLPSLLADILKNSNRTTRNGTDAKGSQWLNGTAQLDTNTQNALEANA